MSLLGWIWYLKLLPSMVSFPLLILPLGTGLIYGRKNLFNTIKSRKFNLNQSQKNLAWIILFIVGSYVLCSLGTNKDSRFIMPYLTGIALLFAYLLNINHNSPEKTPQNIWQNSLKWLTLSLGCILILFNIFPLPFSDQIGGKYLPYQGESWHQKDVIQEIIKVDPYLKSTIGIVAKNTEEINHFTMDYYGRLEDFQVYGREIGASLNNIDKDLRSLSWYLTRSNEPNANQAQIELQKGLENNPEIDLFKTWTLPDEGKLNLYHRKNPFVTVKSLNNSLNQIKIESVTIPPEIPQGIANPITYKIQGNWQELKNGLLLLTWEGNQGKWFHDHGIAMGQIYRGFTQPLPSQTFEVTENIATFPPDNLPDGIYTLKATYLNRQTGETYPLTTPKIEINLNRNIAPIPAPELDWVTQFNQQIIPFSQGKINQVIDNVGVLNFYDPIKDYLKQAEEALNFRLQTNPYSLELWYGIALSQAMQTKVNPLLQTLEKITKIDNKNPYSFTYLAFVHLYNFQPKQAQIALNIAETLDNPPPEIKTLKAISSLMQFNLLKFWQEIK
jgi:4-amino-4-deoxy-L-arabinose transferase-like glycosyltransferase